MRLITKQTLGVLMLAATLGLAAMLPFMAQEPLQAATVNPSVGSSGYFIQTFHFDSQLTATVADKATWKMPWPVELVDIKCSFRAVRGTGSPTYIWTLQAGAANLATCAPTTAATEVSGTIATSSIADESNMTLDYASTGSSPTGDDGTVILVFKRQ